MFITRADGRPHSVVDSGQRAVKASGSCVACLVIRTDLLQLV
jgi:hypothetical protein